jgi:hypothetical protein
MLFGVNVRESAGARTSPGVAMTNGQANAILEFFRIFR